MNEEKTDISEAEAAQNLEDFLGVSESGERRKYWYWGAIGLAIFCAVLLIWWWSSGDSEARYATVKLGRGNLQVEVTATGNLAPINEVSVGSELSGLITKVYVDVNDRVSKGQPLAQIDIVKLADAIRRSQAALDSARAGVRQSMATVTQSKQTLNRQETVWRLSGGKVPSRNELGNIRAEYARAIASLAAARASVNSAVAQLSSDRNNLEKATIRSPINGVILSREIEPGQTVAASFNTPTLFNIAEDLSAMELEVKVDEADVGQVETGQKATFTVDAWPGKTFPATIKRVNLGSNSTTSMSSSSASTVISYGAVLSVRNDDLILRPGMTATATIVTSEEKGVYLAPNAALRFTPSEKGDGESGGGISMLPRPPSGQSGQEANIGRGSKQTIYILNADDELDRIIVTAGASDGTRTIITAPKLKAGMEIVTGELAQSE